METFSALLAICAGNSPVPSEFPAHRPVTWSLDVYFDLRMKKWFSKQSWGWWFEPPSCSLWCQCNVIWLLLNYITILGNHASIFNKFHRSSTHQCPVMHISHQTRPALVQIIYWGQVTHICVSYFTVIGSDNGLSPGRRQAIIWTNAGILLIEPLATNFSEILIGIHNFHSMKWGGGGGGHSGWKSVGVSHLNFKIGPNEIWPSMNKHGQQDLMYAT